jgi:hypothetical protein
MNVEGPDFFAEPAPPPENAPETAEPETEPIGHTHSGMPIYEILGGGTSPEGEKFVRIKSRVANRLPNGEPDFRTTAVGETHVPVDDIPEDLIPKQPETASEEMTREKPDSPEKTGVQQVIESPEDREQKIRELQTPAETKPESGQEAEEQPVPESLRAVREEISSAEANLSALEQKLTDAKEKAKTAIDENNFQEASALAVEAAGYQEEIEKTKTSLEELQKNETMLADVLNPGRIQELMEEIEKRSADNSVDRSRQWDREPLGSYADMVEEAQLAKYLKKFTEKYPEMPAAIAQEISALIDERKRKEQRKSYVYRGDKRAAASIEEEDERSPEPERKFSPGQIVQAMRHGRIEQNWEVEGYPGDSNEYGDPYVDLKPPDGGLGLSVTESLLDNWQSYPSDFVTTRGPSTPTVRQGSGPETPVADMGTMGTDRSVTEPEASGGTVPPAPEPAPEPPVEPEPVLEPTPIAKSSEPGTSKLKRIRQGFVNWSEGGDWGDTETSQGGFWGNIFGPRESEVEPVKGRSGRTLRRMGRIGRRGAQGENGPES